MLISDSYQRRGLGTELLRRLVQAVDHADGMRDKRLSRLRNFIRKYPRVHRMVRALAPQ